MGMGFVEPAPDPEPPKSGRARTTTMQRRKQRMAAGQSLVDRIEERFAPRFDKIDRAIAEMVPRREVDATVARLERDIGELQNRPRQAEASANRWIAVAIAGAGLLISGTCSGAALLLQLLSQLR